MAESPGLSLNLMDQLVFYGSYHQRGWNQVIHFFFVPTIMWSAAVWLAYAPPVAGIDLPALLPPSLPAWLTSYAVANWAAVVLALYTAYYAVMEPFAGLTWGAVIGLGSWLSATAFRTLVPVAWAWALGVHALSWFLQVYVGHILIEHRKPALLDSFFQSIVLAGLFAWLEGLFFLGYRPALKAELERRIHENHVAWGVIRPPGGSAAKEPLLGRPAGSIAAS